MGAAGKIDRVVSPSKGERGAADLQSSNRKERSGHGRVPLAEVEAAQKKKEKNGGL